MLPTPTAVYGGGTPEAHLARKPGRSKVTDLRMVAEYELLRTPCAAEDEGGPLHPDVARERGQTLRLTGQILALTGDLLPTPRSSDTNGAGHHGAGGADLRTVAAEELMPTPSVADVTGGRKARSGARSNELLLNGLAAQELFGRFAPAIRRWEAVLGRSAPAPTERTGRKSGARLSPYFVEWMMGLPAGWVTDPDIGLTRSQQLKALGNGVVPQQGAAAIADMLDAFERTPKEAT